MRLLEIKNSVRVKALGGNFHNMIDGLYKLAEGLGSGVGPKHIHVEAMTPFHNKCLKKLEKLMKYKVHAPPSKDQSVGQEIILCGEEAVHQCFMAS